MVFSGIINSVTSTTLWIFDKAKEILMKAHDLSPKWFKIITFIVLLGVLNTAMSLILELNYACNDGVLYDSITIVGGASYVFADIVEDVTFFGYDPFDDKEEVLEDEFVVYKPDADNPIGNVIYPVCDNDDDARISVIGIEVLNPMIFVLASVVIILMTYILRTYHY